MEMNRDGRWQYRDTDIRFLQGQVLKGLHKETVGTSSNFVDTIIPHLSFADKR